MIKLGRMFRRRANERQVDSYVQALTHLLDSIDYGEIRRAIRAVGETGDAAAIQSLVALMKNASQLRGEAIAALRKLGSDDQAASVELAVALAEDKRGSIPPEPEAEVERRRTPRVLLEIPVMVSWERGARRFDEPSTTQVVSADGALLSLKNPVAADTELTITNLATKATAEARVVWVGNPGSDGRQQTGVKLYSSNPSFWVGART